MEEFKDVNATVEFAITMNNLFDILNSRNLMQLQYKKNHCQNVTIPFQRVFRGKANKYIDGLKTSANDNSVLQSVRHTGLKVAIHTTKLLCAELVEKYVSDTSINVQSFTGPFRIFFSV